MSSDNDSWFTKNGHAAPQVGSQFPLGFRKVSDNPATITANIVVFPKYISCTLN